MPPEQDVDELGTCGCVRLAPAVEPLLTHGEQLLRYGVRHARESFDRSSGLHRSDVDLALCEKPTGHYGSIRVIAPCPGRSIR